ncbi:thiamine phosphate synthase [Rickettsiella endosymbiont of Miltochrista miniata]|uniref:thiamine phosphate synthase n=1 Tax=Rickettsiella endosymbiont of Miltochrista miniata TaxID=3066239 RepID=UPI00313C6E4C
MKQAKRVVINYSDTPGDSDTIDLETLKNFNVQALTLIETITKYTASNITDFMTLLPCADLLICNLMEVEKLFQVRINTYQDIQEATQRLLQLGAKSVLIKASQLKNDYFCHDYWCNQEESFWIATPRLPNQSIIMTKAIFYTAVAACLVRNYSLKDAIVIAKMYVHRGLRKAYTENQTLKFFHSGWPEEQADLPYLCAKPLLKLPQVFKPCRVGLYPIVDSSLWVEKLLTQGVKCIQLRIKDTNALLLEKEIKRSVFLAKKYQAKLFVNDYWQLAIRFNATGVHLGQEDLHDADIDAIYHAGLYLGVSTHCYYEVARAHVYNPSYIACGPIYFTSSKEMSFQPQGIEQLKCWRRTLSYPLVAIGGINLDRLPDIIKSKVDGVSVISVITQASDPGAIIEEFLLQINRPR